MIKIEFLTMSGCPYCNTAKKIFKEIMPDFSEKIKIQEINATSLEGQALAQKYNITIAPGIVIDDELFSTGELDKTKLIEKLASL